MLGIGAHARPIAPGDAAGLFRFHAHLSPHSVEMRFFYPHTDIGSGEVAHFTQVDGVNRVAFVVERSGDLIAVARYDRLDDPTSAEVAFVVADEWQGRGIASLLFDTLASRAREVGIATFRAEVRADNSAMLAVFRQRGVVTTSRCELGIISLTVAIDPDPDRPRQIGTCQMSRVPPPSLDPTLK